MDECTFQNELHSLKQRIADMATRHSMYSLTSRVASRPFPADKFSAQVEDVKQHVSNLEREFQQSTRGQFDTTQSSARCWSPSNCSSPLNPAYGQLITALRDDIQRLGGRMVEVEQAVADMDDKMDRLDPSRFTPPASDSNYDEGVGLYSAGCGSESEANRVSQPAATFSAPEAAGPELVLNQNTLFEAGPFTLTPDAPRPSQIAESLLQVKLGAADVTLDMLRKYNDKMSHVAQFDMGDAEIVRDIVKLHTKLAGDHSWNAARLQNEDEQPSVLTHDIEPRRGSVPASELDAPSIFTAHAEPMLRPAVSLHKPEGVAFRDLEITRLDDLLRDAQESARLSDQQAYQDRQAFAELQVEHDARSEDLAQLQERDSEREDMMDKLRVEAAQRELHLQQLNDYLHTRDEQRERYLQNHQQAVEHSREKSDVIYAQQRRVEELQRFLHDCQSSKDQEIDQVAQGKDEEIRRLQEFCEQKDAIFRSQGEIIARGASLMEQKDAEIELLTGRLKAVHEDHDHEKEQRLRALEIVKARDGELQDLKKRGEVRRAIPADSSRDDSLPEPVTIEPSPFATPVRGAAPWAPRPIPGDRRLAGETHRASVWAQDRQRPTPVFGRPSPMGTWKAQHSGPRRHASSPHPRKIRYLAEGEFVEDRPPIGMKRAHSPEVQNSRQALPLREGEVRRSAVGTPASQYSQRRTTGGARHSLPMDRKVWSPLPAPVTANRMHSMVDMRSAANNEPMSRAHNFTAQEERRPGSQHREKHQGSLGSPAAATHPYNRHVNKHNSMQELKRRDHQAYVETKAESGGEFGGEV